MGDDSRRSQGQQVHLQFDGFECEGRADPCCRRACGRDHPPSLLAVSCWAARPRGSGGGSGQACARWWHRGGLGEGWERKCHPFHGLFWCPFRKRRSERFGGNTHHGMRLPYFASKVTFGLSGVEQVHGLGSLNAHEEKRLEEVKAALKLEIATGLEYAAKL